MITPSVRLLSLFLFAARPLGLRPTSRRETKRTSFSWSLSSHTNRKKAKPVALSGRAWQRLHRHWQHNAKPDTICHGDTVRQRMHSSEKTPLSTKIQRQLPESHAAKAVVLLGVAALCDNGDEHHRPQPLPTRCNAWSSKTMQQRLYIASDDRRMLPKHRFPRV